MSKSLEMFRKALLIAAVFPVLLMSSCADDEEDNALTGPLAGTYIGSFNVSDPSYQNTSYSVDVVHLSDLRIKITPSTSHGTQWEVNLMRINSSLYTCVNCVTNQIQMNIGDNGTQLNYNFGSNEQFSGTRQ
jgi:hypothetical protein